MWIMWNVTQFFVPVAVAAAVVGHHHSVRPFFFILYLVCSLVWSYLSFANATMGVLGCLVHRWARGSRATRALHGIVRDEAI